VVTIVCCHAGADAGRGERLLEPVRRLAPPLLDLVMVKSYGAHQATFDATVPHGNGVDVNFLDREGNDRVRAAYGEAKYQRLAARKHTWDPANLFRPNQNIAPG
jgi:hypothetical protein